MKTITSFVAALIFTVATHAQIITLRPVGGLNFSKLTNYEGTMDEKSQTGIVAGLAANIGISMLSVQPELLYSQKGYKYQQKNGFTEEGIHDYIELPVLLRVAFGPPVFKFFVNAGPYAAYWLSGKEKTHGGGAVKTEDKVDFKEVTIPFLNIKYKPNRIDYGVTFGGGISGNFGLVSISAEARYGLGLADIHHYDPKPTNHKAQNRRVFSILGGIGLSL
jgi:hypothetical protein